MLQDFIDFLERWGVIGLAVAVIIGGKLNEWVSALVDDILMPLVALLIPGGSWRLWAIELPGGSKLLIGHFLGATLDFLIVAFVVYFVFTRLLRNVDLSEDLEKKLGRDVATEKEGS